MRADLPVGKFTPGPWSSNSDGSAVKAGKITVADCIPEHPKDRAPREQLLPNARLIAASPELLSALKFAKRVLTDNGIRCMIGDTDVVEAAIAKATGAQ